MQDDHCLQMLRSIHLGVRRCAYKHDELISQVAIVNFYQTASPTFGCKMGHVHHMVQRSSKFVSKTAAKRKWEFKNHHVHAMWAAKKASKTPPLTSLTQSLFVSVKKSDHF